MKRHGELFGEIILHREKGKCTNLKVWDCAFSQGIAKRPVGCEEIIMGDNNRMEAETDSGGKNVQI